MFENTGQWLQAGVVNIPNVSASIEEGYSEEELNEQQKFLRKHDCKTKRLDFLWSEDNDETIRNASTKADWGCLWFEADPNSPSVQPGFETGTI